MTTYIFANNVTTTLSAPASASATSMTLAVTSGLPSSIAPGTALACTVRDATTRQVMEIVYATAISGNTLTVQRAQESTAARNWQTGDLFFVGPTAGMMATFLQSAQELVRSFNGRTGAIGLSSTDVINALDYTPASLVSPNFGGIPTVPTPAPSNNSQIIANTAWVKDLLSATYATIAYVNSQVAQLAPLASPSLSGNPTAPTASYSVNNEQIATTSFAQGLVMGSVANSGWGNFTSSRALDTLYTNTRGRAIMVAVTVTSNPMVALTIFVDGLDVIANQNSDDGPVTCSASVIVPVGSTYQVTSNGSVSTWNEL